MGALLLKINAVEEGKTILFSECTGLYSDANKTGYGTQTVDISWVTAAQVEITPPARSNPPSIQLPYIVNVFPDFPSVDSIPYEILDGQVGVAGKGITSGKWKIGYRVSGKTPAGIPFSYYTYSDFVFTNKAQCCIDNVTRSTANVPTTVSLKDDQKRITAEIVMAFDFAIWAKECKKFDVADKHLRFINDHCCDGC
jgi:hypothetical protein